MSVTRTATAAALTALPLVTLYLSDRCNSRCVTCDYWRHGSKDMDLAAVIRLLPALRELGTEAVLLSGGEPLLNRQWPQIATVLREAGLKLWLLTSGLSLAKHAARAAQLFDTITVSLDGTDAATYAAIRGVDAFENVCAGIAAAAARGVPVTVRVTLQRANYRQLPEFVALARRLGARQVSFLAVDVANPHAFGRASSFGTDLALLPQDVQEFGRLLEALVREEAHLFQSGFIAENPRKLEHIRAYFAAVAGQGSYPAVRCNAPEFSAVIDADGQVNPCFFIRGAADAHVSRPDLTGALNAPAMLEQRAHIRGGGAPECRTCVCSIWHGRDSFLATRPILKEAERA